MARAVGDADLARGEEGEQDFRFSSGGSPTYGQWVSEELTFENGKQLYIPEGFLHGFVTLEPNSEIIYKCTNFYNKSSEGCVRFNDPDLKISWGKSINDHVISTKDRDAVQFEDFKSPFAL